MKEYWNATNYVKIDDDEDVYQIVVYPYFPDRSKEKMLTSDQCDELGLYAENFGDKPYPILDYKFSPDIWEKVRLERIETFEKYFGFCLPEFKRKPTVKDIFERLLTEYQADRIIRAIKSRVNPCTLYITNEDGYYYPPTWTDKPVKPRSIYQIQNRFK